MGKYATTLILVLMAAATALCLLAVACAEPLAAWMGGRTVRMEYESMLFDTDEVMQVNILMDEARWNEMLANAATEEYYVCDVEINGATVRNTAIRPKGNTSLAAIALDPHSDRFSLKLEFGHFVHGQTCYGLDKLILNNNYADATNMKEAVFYDMYQYLGADASLYNYAAVYVNGEYWGVYLALEAVEDSFMLRNYGTQDGELYKPDSMDNTGGSSSSDYDSDLPAAPAMLPDIDLSNLDPSIAERISESGGISLGGRRDRSSHSGSFDTANPPEGFDAENPQEGFDAANQPDPDSPASAGQNESSAKGGDGGADLNYIDDDLDSYWVIWEGAVSDTSTADRRRVVTALRHISEGTELETYLDVDNLLKYMAVHIFSMNKDSLTGAMAHNYYLYEYNGQLNIFPWDYNLSLGGLSSHNNSATDTVNYPIDTPFSGTDFFNALLENEDYLAQYHAYLNQLVEEYVNGGRFDEVYSRIRAQIDTLVETDPTAFYSYQKYQSAAEIFYEIVRLRAQSIRGQLDGTIPSTKQGQNANRSALLDAYYLDLSAMGQFDMGVRINRDRLMDRNRSSNLMVKDEEPTELPDDGVPAQADGQTAWRNGLVYGGCLAAMLLALAVLKQVRRQ